MCLFAVGIHAKPRNHHLSSSVFPRRTQSDVLRPAELTPSAHSLEQLCRSAPEVAPIASAVVAQPTCSNSKVQYDGRGHRNSRHRHSRAARAATTTPSKRFRRRSLPRWRARPTTTRTHCPAMSSCSVAVAPATMTELTNYVAQLTRRNTT